MCKYCEEPKEAIKDDEDDTEVVIFVGKETEVRFYGGYGWQWRIVSFKFCPICAGRLKEDDNGRA